jgi:SH3-like domain-containing protein
MKKTNLLRLAIGALAFAATPAMAAREPDFPYWASLPDKDANLRLGPGDEYPIRWVYHRQFLPMKVLRAKEGWRFVQDPSGERGWMLARFLLWRQRGAMIAGKAPTAMRDKPDDGAALLWRLAPGVVLKLDECSGEWCKVEMDKRVGYIHADALLGAAPISVKK